MTALFIQTIGISTDGGRTWPEFYYSSISMLPAHMIQECFSLMTRKDLQGPEMEVLRGTWLISTYSWYEKNDFVFDADSVHIYAVANSDSGTSWNYNSLVSDSKGDSGTWNSTFTSSSKIFIAQDPHAIGKILYWLFKHSALQQ